MVFLEEDRYDLELRHAELKLEIRGMRTRINDLTDAKRNGKVNLRK